MDTTNPLSALADVAANLFISLPDSPQGGKPFIDRAEAGSPAALLRAMRKRLNLTQREFGILLSPPGGSAISPSVICQLESALQTVPPQLVSRAVAATTAAQDRSGLVERQRNRIAASEEEGHHEAPQFTAEMKRRNPLSDAVQKTPTKKKKKGKKKGKNKGPRSKGLI